MALRFGFGFQIIQCKLNKGLLPDRHQNHDVLGKYSPSIMSQALPGGGDTHLKNPCDPAQQARFSFLKVRMWAWYRELVKCGHTSTSQDRMVYLRLSEMGGCSGVSMWVSILQFWGKEQREDSC